MPSLYSGNPANYPDQIQLPSDGDPRDAASVNASLEGLADRTARLESLSVFAFVDVEITTTQSFTLPANALPFVDLVGMGGGGGGSGSRGSAAVDEEPRPGGTGGGGARVAHVRVDMTPGAIVTVTIAAGGTAGAAGAPNATGGRGGDGGNSTFGSLATFRGAQGGGQDTTGQGTGGISVKSGDFASNEDPDPYFANQPGQGGPSIRRGGGTAVAAGGEPGVDGPGVGGGGTGGGGGGASEWPGNVAGTGGNGRSYDGSQAGTAGVAGTIGAGGGGGGGSIGYDPGSGGAQVGFAGGAGGPGRIRVRYYPQGGA